MTHAGHTPVPTESVGKPVKRREKKKRGVRNNRHDSGGKTSKESVPGSSVLDSRGNTTVETDYTLVIHKEEKGWPGKVLITSPDVDGLIVWGDRDRAMLDVHTVVEKLRKLRAAHQPSASQP